MKKLIVFGGTGFVGHRVVLRSLARGYEVIIATRQGAPDPGTPTEALARRVADVGGRAAALEALRPGFDYTAPPPPADTAQRTSGTAGAPPSAEAALAAFEERDDAAAPLKFVSIDGASRSQVFNLFHDHPDASAVVSTVGLLTRDYHLAREINGDVNTNIAAGLAHPRLLPAARKLVYLSAEPYNLYDPYILGSKHLLKGYFHGKAIAERAVLRNLGDKGAVLRPGFIYGTRYVTAPHGTNVPGSVVPLPLGVLGWPAELVLSAVGGRKLLTPPIHVDAVAEAAVRICDWAVTGAAAGGEATAGVFDYYRMQEVCALPEDGSTVGNVRAAAEQSAEPRKAKEEEKQSNGPAAAAAEKNKSEPSDRPVS